MEISISTEQANEPVAIMRIKGKIDVSNFLDAVTKVLYHLKKGKEENAITYGYGFDKLNLRTMPSGGSTAKISTVISSATRFTVSTAHFQPKNGLRSWVRHGMGGNALFASMRKRWAI
jgi:hypothetical protein